MAALDLTPLQFANQYLELQAYVYPREDNGSGPVVPGVPAAWKPLPVKRYRLGHSAWWQPLWADISKRLGKTVTVKVKTVAGITEEVALTSHEAQRHFYPPFVGKGSPEQAQIAIQLVYRFRKTVFTPEQFVDKDFIGLDCNGFVGNYIQRVRQGLTWRQADTDKDPGPTTLMEDMFRGQGKHAAIHELKSLRFADTYLFVMCTKEGHILQPSKEHPGSYGHVMITEPKTLKQTPNGPELLVVEATAAGKKELRSIPYTITSATKTPSGTVFHVLRGSKHDQMDVRIATFTM